MATKMIENPIDERIKKDCCNVCQTYVKSGEKGIMCEACKNWYHLKCVKLYDLLLTEGTKQIHWFCNQCDGKVMELCNITAQCEKMERDLCEIRQELNKKADMTVVANSLIELENKIIKQLQTKLSAEVNNRVETHAESFRDIVNNSYRKQLMTGLEYRQMSYRKGRARLMMLRCRLRRNKIKNT